MNKAGRHIRIFLSHRPALYAFIVGASIVLFWRGVWHSADTVHSYITHYYYLPTIDLIPTPWWDGPLSLLVGTLVLFITGGFTSSFIGNELILSGLRGEKKLSERTETEVKSEGGAIADIKKELGIINQKLEQLEKTYSK